MLKEANGKLHQERDRARMERDRLKGLIEKLAEQKTEVRARGLRDALSAFCTARTSTPSSSWRENDRIASPFVCRALGIAQRKQLVPRTPKRCQERWHWRT